VYLIESGETPGKLDTLEKLAKALGCRLELRVEPRKRVT
jgi:hypothetical protein